MANDITEIKSSAGIVAKVAAQMLSDQLQFCKQVTKHEFSDFEGKNGYSAGQTIYTNKPARFVPTTSFDITSSQEDIVEERVALTLDTVSSVGVNLTSQELAYDMNLKALAERVIKPAVSAIAQNVEQTFIEKATDATFNSVGTAGSETFVPDTILSARAMLNKNLAPKDGQRTLLLNSEATREAVDARKALFHSASEVEKQYKQGMVGKADGFDWYETELLNLHTNGTQTVTMLLVLRLMMLLLLPEQALSTLTESRLALVRFLKALSSPLLVLMQPTRSLRKTWVTCNSSL